MALIENLAEVAEILAWDPRKLKNIEANYTVRTIMQEGICTMFERTGYPETVDTHILERILITSTARCAAICRYPENGKSKSWAGKVVCGACTLGDAPDPYGFGPRAIVTFLDGTVTEFEDWRNNPDIVVCWNSFDYSKDTMIDDFARRIGIADVSLDVLVKHARAHSIPVAGDSAQEQAIRQAQEDMLDGKLSTVFSDGETKQILDALGNTESKIEVLSITDPAAAAHIQNITQYREDLWRWFWNMYGMDSRGTTKRAQQSVEEIDSGGDLSMIIPMARWAMRQLEAEQVRIKFDAPDAACDFSTSWRSRIAETITVNEETAEDLKIDDVLEDPAEKQENPENEVDNASEEENDEEVNDDVQES